MCKLLTSVNFVFSYFLAPKGEPTNVEFVAINGSSVKLTWTRPNDYLTDDDYPFDYNVCITNDSHNICNMVVKKLQCTFTGLKPLTTYLISAQAHSAGMSGSSTKLSVSTIEPSKKTKTCIYIYSSLPKCSFIVNTLLTEHNKIKVKLK